MDIGSWADWASSGVALLALVIAGIAARATIQTNRKQGDAIAMQGEGLQIQREQLEDLRLQRVREQAERVIVWYAGNDQISVVNLSDAPVFNCAIAVALDAGNTDHMYYVKDTGIPQPILPDKVVYTSDLPVDLLVSAVLYFVDARGKDWKYDFMEGEMTVEDVTEQESFTMRNPFNRLQTVDELLAIQEEIRR